MFKVTSSSLRVLVSSMVLVAMVTSCATTTTTTPAAELDSPREAVVAMQTVAPRLEQESASPESLSIPSLSTSDDDSPATADVPERDTDGASESAPQPQRVLRRIQNGELNRALVAKASEIIHEHHDEPFGTEIPFEIDGREYVGKIERHYHPEGGQLRPWGYHPGCSLFVVEDAS